MEALQNIELTQLGAVIANLRQSKNWSLAELSQASGLDADFISSIEAGAVEASILDIAAISKALGMTLTTLLQAAGL